MNYLAILQTDDSEWVCLSNSRESAKQGVFDGFNTYLYKIFEAEQLTLYETTSDYLKKRLMAYYKKYLGGKVSVNTLENRYDLVVLELENDKVYRDGFLMPRREQDY